MVPPPGVSWNRCKEMNTKIQRNNLVKPRLPECVSKFNRSCHLFLNGVKRIQNRVKKILETTFLEPTFTEDLEKQGFRPREPL